MTHACIRQSGAQQWSSSVVMVKRGCGLPGPEGGGVFRGRGDGRVVLVAHTLPCNAWRPKNSASVVFEATCRQDLSCARYYRTQRGPVFHVPVRKTRPSGWV